MSKTLERFAAMVVARHDDRNGERLMNSGPEEQIPYVTEQLAAFAKTTPLVPVIGTDIDLAGFGTVPAHFMYGETRFMLLSEIAEELGWPIQKAVKWADSQYDYALRDQRRADEERGDGRLGYEYMRDYVDLGVDGLIDDPEANPDGGGQRWSNTGDWLISSGRLPWLLSCSPWGKEFMDNTMPALGYAMRSAWGDKLKAIPTYTADGQATGGNAFTDLFCTDGLTEDEARRRAVRGPGLDGGPS